MLSTTKRFEALVCILVLGILVVGCQAPAESPADSAQTKSTSNPDLKAVPKQLPPSSSADAGAPSPGEGAALAVAQPIHRPVPIASKVGYSGCMMEKEPSAARQARGGGMERKEDSVLVETNASGLLVKHALNHNCCKKAQVVTTVAGSKVRLLEKMAGPTCRCMCYSTVDTQIPLPAGTYQLTVEVEEQGIAKKAYEQEIRVGK